MSTKHIPISPLRYPGSKARFYKQFRDLFCQLNLNGRTVVEPYAGSASLSISLLAEGLVKSALLLERDPLIFSFWRSVFFHTDQLIEAINDVSVDIATWMSIRKLLSVSEPDENRVIELGLAGLFLNRTNFSGVLHAGPIGGMSQSSIYSVGCRFNKPEIISRISEISALKHDIDVVFGDALNYLNAQVTEDNDNIIYYIDPPYFKEGKKLYRHYYQMQEHAALAHTLTNAKYDWILSYDAHHIIEHLYADFARIYKMFRYSSRTPKQIQELLITNLDFGLNINNMADFDNSRSGIALISHCESLLDYTQEIM